MNTKVLTKCSVPVGQARAVGREMASETTDAGNAQQKWGVPEGYFGGSDVVTAGS